MLFQLSNKSVYYKLATLNDYGRVSMAVVNHDFTAAIYFRL